MISDGRLTARIKISLLDATQRLMKCQIVYFFSLLRLGGKKEGGGRQGTSQGSRQGRQIADRIRLKNYEDKHVSTMTRMKHLCKEEVEEGNVQIHSNLFKSTLRLFDRERNCWQCSAFEHKSRLGKFRRISLYYYRSYLKVHMYPGTFRP